MVSNKQLVIGAPLPITNCLLPIVYITAFFRDHTLTVSTCCKSRHVSQLTGMSKIALAAMPSLRPRIG